VAKAVFEELQIQDVVLIGVAKGETRKAGMEELIEAVTDTTSFRVPPDSPALHLIQHIRDDGPTALPLPATGSGGTRNGASQHLREFRGLAPNGEKT